MSILRKNKTKNFTTIENSLLRDSRLSWKARGLAVYLLSQPDDWKIILSQLEKQAPPGESAKTGMDELIALGYVKRTREGIGQGRKTTVTHIAETPMFENDGTFESRQVGYEPTPPSTDPPNVRGSEPTGLLLKTIDTNNTLSETSSDDKQPEPITLAPPAAERKESEATQGTGKDNYTKRPKKRKVSAYAEIENAGGDYGTACKVIRVWCDWTLEKGGALARVKSAASVLLNTEGFTLEQIQAFARKTYRNHEDYREFTYRTPDFFKDRILADKTRAARAVAAPDYQFR